MAERMLSDHANKVAGDVIDCLNGLPHDEGISILVSILAATLNAHAGDDEDRQMLAHATGIDLLETMRKGAQGDLVEAGKAGA